MGEESSNDSEQVKAEQLRIPADKLKSLREEVRAAQDGRTDGAAAAHLGVTRGRFDALFAVLIDAPVSAKALRDARIAARMILGSSAGPPPTKKTRPVFVVDGGSVYHSMAACPALENTRPRNMTLTKAKAAGRTKCLRCKVYEESEMLRPNPDENRIDPAEDRRGSRSGSAPARRRRRR